MLILKPWNLSNKTKIYGKLDTKMHNFLISINFIIKKVNNTNIASKYLLLEITNEKSNEKKVLFHWLNRS